MTLSIDRSGPTVLSGVVTGRTERESRAALLPGWPLIAALVGMPIWWVLGFAQIIFFVMAIPMAGYLLRARVVYVPRSTGLWLVFLGWVLAGVLTLRVTAPGSLPETGTGGYLTFGYRFGWYLVATIAMLYVANTRNLLSTERINRAIAAFFLTLVGGGYLGLLVSRLEFPSLLELFLPRGLTSIQFVRDLIHPRAAQVQTFLGGSNARPSAPFAYTNIWALNIALTLPFFVTAWWKRGGNWRRAVIPVCVLAAVPVIASLNPRPLGRHHPDDRLRCGSSGAQRPHRRARRARRRHDPRRRADPRLTSW